MTVRIQFGGEYSKAKEPLPSFERKWCSESYEKYSKLTIQSKRSDT